MFKVNNKANGFIVNFEHISHLCSSVSIVNFEHVIAGWERFFSTQPQLIGPQFMFTIFAFMSSPRSINVMSRSSIFHFH